MAVLVIAGDLPGGDRTLEHRAGDLPRLGLKDGRAPVLAEEVGGGPSGESAEVLVDVGDAPLRIEHHRHEVDRVEQVAEPPLRRLERPLGLRALVTHPGQDSRPAAQHHERPQGDREDPAEAAVEPRVEQGRRHVRHQLPRVRLRAPLCGNRDVRLGRCHTDVLLFLFHRTSGDKGKQAGRGRELPCLRRLDPGPLRWEGLRERLRREGAPRRALRARSPQPCALAVEQGDLPDCWCGGPGEGSEELRAIIIEQDDSPLAPLPIDDRSAKADHGLIGVLDLFLLDVALKR